MPRSKRPGAIPSELPLCKGPKLRTFEHHDCKVQWLERLGDDEDCSSPAQGFVFRVKIKGRDYAIKVFKFYDPRRVKHSWAPLIGSDPSLETISYYIDPFYNECRAYGRIHDAIKQRKLRPNIIVPCHGFMFLSDKDMSILDSRGIDLQLSQVPREYQKATIGGCRARAIVKDLASGDPGVDDKSIRKILRDVLTLNYQGVYNMDIRLDNFRDGKLVDFGSALTDPHIFLEHSSDENADEERVADRTMFNEMVEDNGISLPKGIGPIHDMRLRRRRR